MAATRQVGFGLAALTLLGTAAAAHADPASCTALAAQGLFPATTVGTSTWHPAGDGVPSFCEVSGTISPAAGSTIGVVYRLPDNWNGKILGLGGGGWAGNLRQDAADPGLKRGYATAQTDGGHATTSPWDTSWSSRPAAVTDFAYRAIHQMTATGKAVVARYYGRSPQRSYFEGCSTGGRQGLMEAQRFPDDYDGIISGAPVYTLQVQTSSMLRNQTFRAPGAGLSPALLDAIAAAAVKACDGQDGLRDGLIGEPRQCRWDPAELACTTNATGACLTTPQLAALRTAYAGVRTSAGDWAMFPLNRGGEAGWSRFIQTDSSKPDVTGGGGLIGLRPLLFGDTKVDLTALVADRDVPAARASAFAKEYEASDPAIGAFVRHGGKLILWHGQSDPGPSPVGTVDYYKKVARADPKAAASVRLFLAPGVEHCRGGPGPDQLETLAALEQWVEQGRAPATILATRLDGTITRPLCPYPAQAHYTGKGDVNAPASYTCHQ
ncbi:MAG: tannase/feruloyl esterase family alpha/beta hydrolase [Janthinobacterium lividum]